MIIQRARMKWLNDGGANSKFFHAIMKKSLHANHIFPISTSMGVVSSVKVVKGEVNNFAHRFKEEDLNRPILEGYLFKKLDIEDKCSLELPFEEGDIKEAIWNCDGSKNPGPDGYSIMFNKRCWFFLKDDFVACFRYFHDGSVLSKSITSSFMALIPKFDNPLGLDDYRSICLVGCIYEILSKLLAGRLKKVFSLSQNTVVPRRILLDGVLIANERVHYTVKKKKSCLLFKVDFEKAYDKVSWHFLRFMLISMGFGEEWLKWLEAMVFNSHMSVMVNGSPTKYFRVEKGLRQGDPIYPFLFVIVAEDLKGLINKAVEKGNYAGFFINRSCFIDVL